MSSDGKFCIAFFPYGLLNQRDLSAHLKMYKQSVQILAKIKLFFYPCLPVMLIEDRKSKHYLSVLLCLYTNKIDLLQFSVLQLCVCLVNTVKNDYFKLLLWSSHRNPHGVKVSESPLICTQLYLLAFNLPPFSSSEEQLYCLCPAPAPTLPKIYW